MADNIAITAGSGTTVAADDISSVFYQRVKLSLGADGTANDAVAGSGVNGVGVQRMTIATDDQTAANINNIVGTKAAGTAAAKSLLTGGVYNASGVTLTDGQQAAAQFDAAGNLLVKLPAVAHDAADSGSPIKVGAKAIAALSGATLVSAADRTDMQSDLDGALLMRSNGAIGDYVSGTASVTDTTATSVIAAGATGVKHYLTGYTFANSSAAATLVAIKDGSTTKAQVLVPAGSTVSGTFATPIAGTAATAWNMVPGTGVSTLYGTFTAFKSKI